MFISPTRHSPTRLLLSLCLALFLSGLLPLAICMAQTNSGTVVGRVRDMSGRALKDAQITLVNEQSGNERSTRTNADGYFSLPNLRSGIYRVRASKQGFFSQTYERFPV
ncbi:MAG TPA: carboxypeptidase-like regulatory domain-containing protein, partial [Pyrinomonadaceae bacterium]